MTAGPRCVVGQTRLEAAGGNSVSGRSRRGVAGVGRKSRREPVSSAIPAARSRPTMGWPRRWCARVSPRALTRALNQRRGSTAAVVLLGSAAGLLFTGSAAAASPPSRVAFSVDETFRSPFTSAVCGFDVFVHVEGTAVATVFFDDTGTPVREIDTQPNLKITVVAPSTGRSFTYPRAGALTQDYSAGTAIGSPALATLTGLIEAAGSTAPDAGRIVIDAVIVAIGPEGIPIVDFVSEVAASGHFNTDLAGARCAALSDS